MNPAQRLLPFIRNTLRNHPSGSKTQNTPRPLLSPPCRCYSPLPVRPTGLRSSRSLKRNRPSQPFPTTPTVQRPPDINVHNPSFPWTDYDALPSTGSASHLDRVDVPSDPSGFIQASHPAASLLAQPALVVVRQLEMLNLFVGFEQANRYRILNPAGETVGFLAEENSGFTGTLLRQIAGTHRAFQASVLAVDGTELLRIRRPFSFINSRISIECPHRQKVIGEAQQEFHIWRRKYGLFTTSSDHIGEETVFEQFAKIDAGLFSWEFFAQDANEKLMGSVSRNFAGFGREIFTDTGQYVIRFEAVEEELKQLDQIAKTPFKDSTTAEAAPVAESHLAQVPSREIRSTGLTLDQRAVMLATAVSIDFDYFTRSRGGGLMPPMFFGGSDELQSGGTPSGTQANGPDPLTTGIGAGVMDGMLSQAGQPRVPDLESGPSTYDEEQLKHDKSSDLSDNAPPGWSETPIDQAWVEEELEDPWSAMNEKDENDWDEW
ncbi:Scramblase-domain-containing protein [Melampsora americana]|nr:Scramblase-domain-containing protein [Melampsora americana]